MKTLLFILVFVVSIPSFADEVLAEVQLMMTDRQQMDKLAKDDPTVKKADDFVNQVVGTGKEKDDLMKISAEVMGNLAKKHNGDVEAMKADLLESLKDPKKFLEGLSPDQKKQIRSLANEVENKHKAAAPPKP